VITQSELKEILNYDVDTGVFTRISTGMAYNKPRARYVRISLKCKRYLAHRLAWLYVFGDWPLGVIDHINGIGTDNSIKNLRDVSMGVNLKNKKNYKNSWSGFAGVRWIEEGNKWRARLGVDGGQVNIGSFECKIDAIASVIRARKEYCFHENHGGATK